MSASRRFHPPVDKRRALSLKDIRPVTTGALRLVWAAGRREAVTVLAMVTLQGLGVFVILVQIAQLAGGLIDAENGADVEALPSDVLLFIAANSVVAAAGVVVANRRTMLAERTALFAQGRILEVACLAELDDYDDAGFHDRLRRASNSAQERPMMLIESVLELLRSLFMLMGIAVALVVVQPWMAVFVVLAIVPIWLGGIRSGQQYFEFVVEMTQADRTRGYLYQLLTSREAAKEVRAFELGGHLSTTWTGLMEDRLRSLLVTLRKRFRSAMIAALGSNAVLAAVAVVLITLTRTEVMSLAEAATAAGALLLFSQKLMDLIQATGEFFQAGPLIQDLQDFLALEPALRQAREGPPAPPAFERLTVDGVSFTYKGANRRAVDDVSLDIRAGEVIALVGENGAGKTTLTKILGGLYPVDEGRVTVDGVDLATLDPESWRKMVAVVFQDYLHYAMSATDNVRFGDVDADGGDAAVQRAARAAGADAFLSALPHGYETILSPQFDDGQDLSLGQWQRVALARAFYRSAPVVILDEPTASLDARAERALFDTVRDLYRGRTVLLISHRFSTVRSADRIVVMTDGRVTELGTHDELMGADGLYAELFTMQASSYLSPVPGEPRTTAAP